MGVYNPGNYIISSSSLPDVTYKVRLTDAETGDLVREGKLTGGQDDLYLGDDHSSYKVKMEATSGFSYYNM